MMVDTRTQDINNRGLIITSSHERVLTSEPSNSAEPTITGYRYYSASWMDMHWGTSSKFCMIWPHDIVDIVDSESWRSAVQRKIHRINSCPTKCLNLVWPHGKATPAAATPESPATQTETAPDTPSDHLRAVGQKGTSKFPFKHS